MPTYAVKRSLPGITMEQLGDAQKAAIETCEKVCSEGTDVKYIRSNFFPGDSSLVCLFEGPDAQSVKSVNDRASLPYNEVVEVMDLVP